jgi:hypothetical protein
MAGKTANSFRISEDLVGAGRFERPTPCAQGRCATRLRYAPTVRSSVQTTSALQIESSGRKRSCNVLTIRQNTRFPCYH